jgi:hypothetical protein
MSVTQPTGLPANPVQRFVNNQSSPLHFCCRKTVSGLGDRPKKINLFIEASSTLGNNAPAVLSQQRKMDDD